MVYILHITDILMICRLTVVLLFTDINMAHKPLRKIIKNKKNNQSTVDGQMIDLTNIQENEVYIPPPQQQPRMHFFY